MDQEKIEQARHMYFAQAKTQKEIALLLDVSEKTIYNWIKRHSWDQLRQAARQAPAMISENLASQLVELQNSIARREPGCRYPTDEESRIMLRLVTMMEKMKKFPSLSMNMQVMTTFSNWASTRDKAFTRDLSLYSGLFLQGYAKNGYHPYELEFGIEKINPIDLCFQEETIAENPKPPKKDTTESMANGNVMTSLPDDVIPGLPDDVILSLSKEETVKSTADASRDIENQSFRSCDAAVKPVKTGNFPANKTPDDFPLRKWLPDLNSPNANSEPTIKAGPKQK